MLELMPPFYFLTFAKVSVSVSKKFGLKKVSVSVSKTFGLKKKSRYRSWKYLVSKKSLGLGIENFGLEKKSRYRSRKYLVSKKSLGIGLENIWSRKKVSVSVLKIFGLKQSLENLGLKKLSIGLKRFGLKKSIRNGLQNVLVFHIFPDRKWECNRLLLKFFFQRDTSNTLKRFCLIKCFNSSLKKIGLRIGLGTLPKAQRT